VGAPTAWNLEDGPIVEACFMKVPLSRATGLHLDPRLWVILVTNDVKVTLLRGQFFTSSSHVEIEASSTNSGLPVYINGVGQLKTIEVVKTIKKPNVVGASSRSEAKIE